MRVRSKWIALSCVALLSASFLSGCGSNKDRMMFGTGGTAGTYYSYGGIIAQYITNYADIKVTAVSTGGSKVNIQSIEDGDFQLGFTQSDVMAYAWAGTKSFENDGPTHDFRVLGGLYAETVQLITMDDDIDSVDDLKGKSVSIGAASSGVYFNAMDVFEAAGITLDDIHPQYLSFEDSKESLKDGKIDAAFIVAGAPTTAITELATTNGVKIIDIDGELRDTLLANCPYYAPLEIPANTYPKQPDPIETITVKATVVVDADLPEDEVYEMTAAIFDHAEDITKENAKGKELTLENATQGMAAPFHKGAAKYYAEHGITVATNDDFVAGEQVGEDETEAVEAVTEATEEVVTEAAKAEAATEATTEAVTENVVELSSEEVKK